MGNRTVIYDDIRNKIISGALATGACVVAKEFSVGHGASLKTVGAATALLAEEGLLEYWPGRGYFVREGAQELAERQAVDALAAGVSSLVGAAKRIGIDQAAFVAIVKNAYKD